MYSDSNIQPLFHQTYHPPEKKIEDSDNGRPESHEKRIQDQTPIMFHKPPEPSDPSSQEVEMLEINELDEEEPEKPGGNLNFSNLLS